MIRRLLLVVLLGSAGLFGVRHIRHRAMPQLTVSNTAHPTGAFHVHSEASHDSDVPLEQIAETAQRLGMAFVIVTDHNNQLAGPITLSGVTLLSYAELSTPVGHLIQLGARTLPDADMRGSLQLPSAITSRGGIPVVAHPGDPKRPWTGSMAHMGGIEIANLSSSARRRAGPLFVGLLPALAAWRLNLPLAMAQVYDRDERGLARWDEESDPKLVGLCGVDAHGLVDLSLNMQGWRVVLHHALPEVETERPLFILDQLEQGRFHCAAGLFGTDPAFRFAGQRGGRWNTAAGDSVPADEVDTLIARGPGLERGEGEVHTVLLRNGEQIARTVDRVLVYAEPDIGTYRVEVRVAVPSVLWGHRLLPVLYSNRIRVTQPPRTPVLDPGADPDMSELPPKLP